MKTRLYQTLICSVCLFIFASAYAQDISSKLKTGKIELKFYGLKSDKGMLKIALDNSKEGYEKEKSLKYDHVSIKNKKASFTFEDLPFGDYVVKVYHDANNNNKMDTNFLGAPKEAYGFSNNVRGIFGPPDYEDVKFSLDKKMLSLEIEVK
jgi:uncharacterized protein (DUF2141 family)